MTAGRPPARLDVPLVLAAVVAAACILASVTFHIDDPDVWQHLLVGKAMWTTHSIPRVHLWSWPTYGSPEVLPSWGFRALLWPFWAAGGVTGLFAWRWLMALVAFGLAWAAARRMGARGLVPLLVVVVCALGYRARSQVRPETLVAVLLALEILLLESLRRAPSRRATLALVAVACVWANVHLSYYLGLALLAIHLLAAWGAAWAARRPRGPSTNGSGAVSGELGLAFAAACIVAFLNPFGWRALAQPFEYALVWSHEPIFQTIEELQPIVWRTHLRDGIPLLLAGWPLLIAWRWRRGRADGAEALTCALFGALALSTQRFTGFFAVAAAPYVARGLAEWVAAHPLPPARLPYAARTALVAAACVLVCVPEWSRPRYRFGVAVDPAPYPIHACDYLATHAIAGRGFNPYYFGGYQLWRFWPERGRLPFMDIHQSGTRADRDLYAFAFANPGAWAELDRRHRFDYAVLDGHPESLPGDRLLDTLDRDSTWALVFRDDAAAVYVRRGGSTARLAESEGYLLVPGGDGRLPALTSAAATDSLTRAWMRLEAARMIASSPDAARAHTILASVAWIEGAPDSARAHLERALVIDPRRIGVHRQLGILAMAARDPRRALAEFTAERRTADGPDLAAMIGAARESLATLERR